MCGGVPLGEGEHLFMAELVDRPRWSPGDESIDEPHQRLTAPERKKLEHIRVRILHTKAVGKGEGAEPSSDLDAGSVICHQCIAEAEDEGAHSPSRTTWTEQEIQGS